MKVDIKESFEGFPDGTDASRTFYAAGAKDVEVPDEFGDLIIAKGHAEKPAGAAKKGRAAEETKGVE